MKYYVNAMARSIREVSAKLSNHTEEIVEHLIKLYVMPSHSARNHWKQEIYTQINRVEKLAGANRFPTKKQISKWTYETYQDTVTDVRWMTTTLRDICETYNVVFDGTLTDVIRDIDSICSQYFLWLAEQLSEYGRVTRNDVYAKLDLLIQ